MLKKLIVASMGTAIAIASQAAFSHTRLQVPVIEGSATLGHAGKVNYNNVVVAHGCHDPVSGNSSAPVIATSTVFPTSTADDEAMQPTITNSDGTPAPGNVDDYLEGWIGSNRLVVSNDVWKYGEEKFDALGNRVGFHVKGGSLPASGSGTLRGLVPFVTTAVRIPNASCAKSVTLVVAIADICKMTPISGFNDETVQLWTPAVGSNFDGVGGHGYNSPATLTILRAATAPLDPSCGAGVDVKITPSAAQINRDLPIVVKGKQVWPRP
ncbi:hypothetical protein ACW73L_11685 [Methylolobus aquaticus]